MISAEEWDTRWWVIFEDLVNQQGIRDGSAFDVADRECTEQFGDRPQDADESKGDS